MNTNQINTRSKETNPANILSNLLLKFFDPLQLILVIFMSFGLITVNAQSRIVWDKTYGSPGTDGMKKVLKTPDGGYLFAGYSSGIGVDKTAPHWGVYDYWLIKTDSDGVKIWDASFGGDAWDKLDNILPSIDGGYMLFGIAESRISGNKSTEGIGPRDIWLVKINEDGIKQWDKTIGSTSTFGTAFAQPTPDGGYWVAWWQPDDSCSIAGYAGKFVKINRDGIIEEERRLCGKYFSNFLFTKDGNFLVNYTRSTRIVGVRKDENTVAKFTPELDEIWSFPWTDHYIRSFIETVDFNYLIIGGDYRKGMVTKINYRNGLRIWQHRYMPEIGNGELKQAVIAGDHNIILGGSTWPGPYSIEDMEYTIDYWAVKIDNFGNLKWRRKFGGDDADHFGYLANVQNNTYLLAGHSRSPISRDKTHNSRGGSDYWFLKIKDKPAGWFIITAPDGTPATPSYTCETFGPDDRILPCDWPFFLEDLPYPNFNIKFDFFKDPRSELASVLFKINGKVMNIDNKAPYMLFEPAKLMKNKDQLTLTPGDYKLEIIAYSKANGKGEIIESLAGNLQVLKGNNIKKQDSFDPKQSFKKK